MDDLVGANAGEAGLFDCRLDDVFVGLSRFSRRCGFDWKSVFSPKPIMTKQLPIIPSGRLAAPRESSAINGCL